MQLKCFLPEWNCKNKTIIVRADLNVPLKNGTIINDLRLRAIQPTLDEILKKQATTILMTHLGRPKEKEPALSTNQLMPWFKKHNYPILFAPTIQKARELALENASSIILLENLRFFPGEKENSEPFAQELAHLGDFFVQDAFGALHKNEASISLLPTQFTPEKRTVGFLVHKELNELSPLITNPPRPFCVILGGAKIVDKIPLIEHLQKRADTILLCPALIFSFLKAEGKPVGKSIVDNEILATCSQILKKNNLVFPQDYQVAHNDKEGTLSFTETLSENDMGISIGPKTIQLYSSIIKKSKAIFFNGAIGFQERPETLQGMKALFQAMAESTGKSIIAGGDSTAAYEQFDIHGTVYLSTGGGASLAYLSGQTLPGLTPFELENRAKSDQT